MRDSESESDYQYQLVSKLPYADKIEKDAHQRYTTYLKKAWDANQRIIQPDILIESSFDIDTVIDFNQDLLNKKSKIYAQEKQKLLDLFLEKYTLGGSSKLSSSFVVFCLMISR